ncbi:MAG TPA: hypothetical protein DCQ58_02600 [Saprospirales bacterium]|nr:hypothetical protein [Saprospirales bacterium]
MHSGHSLDYYNKNGKLAKDTTIHFYGLAASENNKTQQVILNSYADLIRNAKLNFDAFGDPENRLLMNL